MNKYGVVAIHGGNIEPGTSEITRSIAGSEYLFYLNEDTPHIPSNTFHNPNLDSLLNKVETIISIHGEKSEDESFVMIGGLDKNLGKKVEENLKISSFRTKNPPENLNGDNPENICNKGKSGKGVQLEISRKLRNELMENPETMTLFCNSIRESL